MKSRKNFGLIQRGDKTGLWQFMAGLESFLGQVNNN